MSILRRNNILRLLQEISDHSDDYHTEDTMPMLDVNFNEGHYAEYLNEEEVGSLILNHLYDSRLVYLENMSGALALTGLGKYTLSCLKSEDYKDNLFPPSYEIDTRLKGTE